MSIEEMLAQMLEELEAKKAAFIAEMDKRIESIEKEIKNV